MKQPEGDILPLPALGLADMSEWKPDWLATFSLPWCNVVAIRGGDWYLRFHFGALKAWVGDGFSVTFRDREIISAWRGGGGWRAAWLPWRRR